MRGARLPGNRNVPADRHPPPLPEVECSFEDHCATAVDCRLNRWHVLSRIPATDYNGWLLSVENASQTQDRENGETLLQHGWHPRSLTLRMTLRILTGNRRSPF